MTRTRALVVVILIQFGCLGWLGWEIVGALNQIQESRAAACAAQNMRHDRTISTLDAELKKYSRHAPPARRAEIRASRASTVALINQLAPHLNCIVVIHRTRVGPS